MSGTNYTEYLQLHAMGMMVAGYGSISSGQMQVLPQLLFLPMTLLFHQ